MRSLRRAVTLTDGWCPFGITAQQARDWLSQLVLPPGFEVVLGTDRPLDPVKDPEAAKEALTALRQAGATIASARFVHHSLEQFLEQLEALAVVHSTT
jgi:hypothetical protein